MVFLTEIPTDGSSKLAAFPDGAAGRCGPLRERDHRPIFYVSDVDVLYSRLVAAGFQPDIAPRDAEWGERFFHLSDPDGHELSFARPLRS